MFTSPPVFKKLKWNLYINLWFKVNNIKILIESILNNNFHQNTMTWHRFYTVFRGLWGQFLFISNYCCQWKSVLLARSKVICRTLTSLSTVMGSHRWLFSSLKKCNKHWSIVVHFFFTTLRNVKSWNKIGAKCGSLSYLRTYNFR